MFECRNCGIAYFKSVGDLRRHHRDCASATGMQEMRGEIQELKTLVAGLVDSVTSMSSTLAAVAATTRKRRRSVRADDDSASTSTNLLTPEQQLVRAVAYFTSRKLVTPVSVSFVEEVETLLNELWPSPALSFADFQREVAEDAKSIRSLFSEFQQLMSTATKQKSRRRSRAAEEEQEEEEEGEEEEEEEEQEESWPSAVAASDLGGSANLLLKKLLDFFHGGFRKYRFGFPMVVFDVGRRKNILKLCERLFARVSSGGAGDGGGEEDEDEEEEGGASNLEDEDLDQIACFPFFVYVDAEQGWKIMKYVDHVYPIFLAVQSSVMMMNIQDTDEMMARQESNVLQFMGAVQTINDNRVAMMTRKVENSFESHAQLVSKLSMTVLTFMTSFRKKHFAPFLSQLYQDYSLKPAQWYQAVVAAGSAQAAREQQEEKEQEAKEEEQSTTTASTPVAVVGKRPQYVYYIDEEDQVLE